MKNQFSVLHLAIVSCLAMASTSALAQSDVSSTDQSIERLIVTGDLSGLGVDEIANSATIIDESLIAHISIVNEQGPIVIPMLAWRVDDDKAKSSLGKNLSKLASLMHIFY